MKNGDLNAYPQVFTTEDGDIGSISGGLSKREHFAALAMQATDLEAYAVRYGKRWASEVAKDSVLMADALLSELEKPNQNGQ